MDNIIQKKSTAGRPRTRSDQETTTQSSPASRRSSRLSILSTTSTVGSFTPNNKKKYDLQKNKKSIKNLI
jgi:hypothetical protein